MRGISEILRTQREKLKIRVKSKIIWKYYTQTYIHIYDMSNIHIQHTVKIKNTLVPAIIWQKQKKKKKEKEEEE